MCGDWPSLDGSAPNATENLQHIQVGLGPITHPWVAWDPSCIPRVVWDPSPPGEPEIRHLSLGWPRTHYLSPGGPETHHPSLGWPGIHHMSP